MRLYVLMLDKANRHVNDGGRCDVGCIVLQNLLMRRNHPNPDSEDYIEYDPNDTAPNEETQRSDSPKTLLVLEKWQYSP